MKVFLNPGHAPGGNPDPGAVNEYTGLRESDVAYAVANKVAKYLVDAGVQVAKVCQNDSLSQICTEANDSGADIFVSIHCNAATNPMANGTETYYYGPSEKGARLARCIQNQLINAMDTDDRGIKPGNGLYVIRHTDMPAVLVELAFISNRDDVILLEENQDDFARAIARGVTDYQQG